MSQKQFMRTVNWENPESNFFDRTETEMFLVNVKFCILELKKNLSFIIEQNSAKLT